MLALPLDYRNMDNNVEIDWFQFWSTVTPHAAAITIASENHTVSYQQVNERAYLLAAGLYEHHNITKGDRIGVISKNCIEYIYLFAAAQKLGFILVPFNYRLTNFELNQVIENANPSLVFVSSEFSHSSFEATQLPIEKSLEIESHIQLPQPEVPKLDDPIFILYTSGSSGIPKGVLYTHKMLFWNSVNTSVSLGINGLTKALVTMPPFHTGGWNVLLTPVLHHGGQVIICEKFDASETLLLLEQYGCDQFMAVPTMLKMIAQDPLFDQVKLKRLQYIIVGGEAMPLELIHTYENRHIAVRQGFGMTEAGPNLTSLHHDYSTLKLGSIGKPNMYVKVLLLNDNDEIAAVGENGELCFAGPIVTPGYWQKDMETTTINGVEWFRSGDIAMLDAEGFLFIRDRKKNMFISGGENVYPAEIESVLLSHKYIEEVAVIGVADEQWGEVGKAFIVTNHPINKELILSFCAEKLSKFKIPKHIVFTDSLPLNSTGKINKLALQKL